MQLTPPTLKLDIVLNVQNIKQGKIKRTSLSVGGAIDLPKDHQLLRLPPLLAVPEDEDQQVEEVVVEQAVEEQVAETEA